MGQKNYLFMRRSGFFDTARSCPNLHPSERKSDLDAYIFRVRGNINRNKRMVLELTDVLVCIRFAVKFNRKGALIPSEIFRQKSASDFFHITRQQCVCALFVRN